MLYRALGSASCDRARLDQIRMMVPVEQIARDALLPHLAGFRLISPSPFVLHLPSVLLYREPIEDVLVGVQLATWDEREFSADYVSMPLLAPTDSPLFQPAGMERDGILRRFFTQRRWVLDGRNDSGVIDRLADYVVHEGIPILARRAALSTFADELLADEHEWESDPISTEEAAYARILIGRDGSAMELLEILIRMPGRGWLGETEISEDEMEVLRERARRMIAHLRTNRPAAIDQLRRWRLARLASIGLDGEG